MPLNDQQPVTSTLTTPTVVSPANHASSTASIVLCPGQGAQHIGMGKSWFDRYQVAKQTFAAADDALGFEISRLCFEGSTERINRTDVAQVAIYVTSVACYQALIESDQITKPTMTAGLSLGEFTALHLAGAFDFTTGLSLVRLRGQAMQEAAQATPGGMVALVGVDEKQAQRICDTVMSAATPGQVLVPANYNCPGQIVISGSLEACQQAVDVAGDLSIKATALKVAGAFHSPLMQPAADRLAKALDQVAWNRPNTTVLSNVTGQPHDASDIESIKSRLVEQLTSPVHWSQSMSWAVAQLQGSYVELAPGKVLAGLMRRIDRNIRVTNHAETSA